MAADAGTPTEQPATSAASSPPASTLAKKPLLSEGALDLLAGMTSGFFVKIVEYPFDTVKVLQQTMGSRYTGAWDCIATTYRGGGMAALYKGLASPLLGSMAECSTLFVAYGFMKRALEVDEDKATLANPVPMWKYFISGAGSGFFSAFVLTPVELVKCRLQVQAGLQAAGEATVGKVYKGPIDCVAHIVKTDGVRGLYKGNMGCLAREMPGNLAWFGAYELVLRGIQHAKGYDKKKDVPLYWSALAGSAAGVAYWGVPFPADTLKSKMQTDARFSGLGYGEAFKTIVREDGFRGLYRGCGITCARAAPSHALLFFAYEVAADLLRKL